MGRGLGAQNLAPDVTQLIDQLERHCLAPDGSFISKSTYYDLQMVTIPVGYLHLFVFFYTIVCECVYFSPMMLSLRILLLLQAREEMCKERQRYLEALVLL